MKTTAPPGGISSNELWHEGALRGTPDVVRRVETPPGGIEGSTGALLFATKNSGIPGRPSGKQQQDDLLMKFDRRLGRSIPMNWQPSCTVRVYSAAVRPVGTTQRPVVRHAVRLPRPQAGRQHGTLLARHVLALPQREWQEAFHEDFAQLTIRSGPRGNDIRSVKATEPGWWTMGMSFTPDGQVHYYASPGVDDLTSDDYLVSYFPYGNHCVSFNNFFFNVANLDNGRSWSTKWIIDDPQVFVVPPQGQTVAQLYKVREEKHAQSNGPHPDEKVDFCANRRVYPAVRSVYSNMEI